MARMFERVVIVGPGLVGGSLGQALRANGLAGCVVGVGHRQVSMDHAIEVGAVDESSLNLVESVPDADLVVLATGVGLIPKQAGQIIPHMKPSAIVSDVGSVKGSICRAIAEHLAQPGNPGVRFVGGHPLAGSEQRGIEAARPDLFRGARCILTPTSETDADALAKLRSLWEAVGCRVTEFPPDRHDRLVAEMSHLPHAVAACLVNSISDDAFDLAATGLTDTTRVASGDAALWVDICMENSAALSSALRIMAGELERFACRLDAADRDSVLKSLADAKARRDTRANG